MIKIYWHNKVLRTFDYTERERAKNAWEFFNKFLINLHYIEE